MFSLITVSFSLLFVALTGWTITTYFVKEDSQDVITKELKNLFDISKMFFISLRGLIGVLAKNSFSSYSSETHTDESKGSEDHTLSLIQPFKEVESPSSEVPLEEDHDTALSSFSQNVVEVIEEEEEKVA
tara:strand:- start:186 stop:575 length:390 start_codon:yes stop_codon:yes gene_type:complete